MPPSSVGNNGHYQGKSRGGCIPPLAIFNNVFSEYNFSIILNLFDNTKPYALSTHESMCVSKMHPVW